MGPDAADAVRVLYGEWGFGRVRIRVRVCERMTESLWNIYFLDSLWMKISSFLLHWPGEWMFVANVYTHLLELDTMTLNVAGKGR